MRFDAGILEENENATKRWPSGTNGAKTFENPIVRGLPGISSASPPEITRPTSQSIPERETCAVKP